MALNAHMAIFKDLEAPDKQTPSTGSDEATKGIIPGTSSIIPASTTKSSDQDADAAKDVKWIELDGIRFQVRHDGLSYPIVEIKKLRDIASPLLAKNCCGDTVFSSAKILVLWPSGAGNDANAIREVIRLYDVTIESVRAVFSSDAEQSETVMLRYKKISWTCGTLEAGWNLEAGQEWTAPESADLEPPPAEE